MRLTKWSQDELRRLETKVANGLAWHVGDSWKIRVTTRVLLADYAVVFRGVVIRPDGKRFSRAIAVRISVLSDFEDRIADFLGDRLRRKIAGG